MARSSIHHVAVFEAMVLSQVTLSCKGAAVLRSHRTSTKAGLAMAGWPALLAHPRNQCDTCLMCSCVPWQCVPVPLAAVVDTVQANCLLLQFCLHANASERAASVINRVVLIGHVNLRLRFGLVAAILSSVHHARCPKALGLITHRPAGYKRLCQLTRTRIYSSQRAGSLCISAMSLMWVTPWTSGLGQGLLHSLRSSRHHPGHQNHDLYQQYPAWTPARSWSCLI